MVLTAFKNKTIMMETKFTEATLNRPEGDRIIDAPFVFADLEKYNGQLKKEEAWRKSDRNSITIYKTEGVTIVLTCLHKHAAITNNSVDGLLTVQVVEGSIDFTVEKKILRMKKNQLVTVHAEIVHSIDAREDTTLLLITKN
jgi:quercetin dioxygenase-like cupin family protein